MSKVSSMKLYLAGRVFTTAEQAWNKALASSLKLYGYEVALPQEFCEGLAPAGIFGQCIQELCQCQAIIVNSDGADVDSGTCFELGFAYAISTPRVVYRTDFRQGGDCDKNVNLMIGESGCSFIEAPLASAAEIAGKVHVALTIRGE